MALEPAIQQFGINAAAFLAGIDEMLERTDKLAESLDAVIASAKGMADSLSASAAKADEGVNAAAASLDRFAESEKAAEAQTAALVDELDAVLAAADRAAEGTSALGDAEKAAADAAAFEAGLLADLTRQEALLADGAKILTDSLAAEARAMKVAGDSAAVAGDEMVVVGSESEAASVKMDTARDSAVGMGSAMKTALLGVAVAAVYGIDKASGFQSSIEQLHTQAGVAQSKLAGLSQGVLKLAGQVGEGPQSLAESLYHVESNMASMGATSATVMSAVKIAAEGAQVGGANLVDVTNALTAAVASGIPGVQNFSQAMGDLNATVGSGDMHMQDLADAFSTGLLAVVKGYGLSLKDVGAALATFGDNNIRGAKAGTDLRMAVQALAVPVATAKTQLAALGLTQTSLANDMKSGGLMKALDDLTGRFKTAGITAKDQGEVITTLFGKKAGSGIAVLLEQMDRLKSKYPAITSAANNFAGDWAARQKTMSQQWDNLKSGAQALAISFGTVLLPMATKVVGALAKFAGFLEQHPLLAEFAGGILAVAVAMKIAATAAGLFSAAIDANPVSLIIMGVIALGFALYELYTHFKSVRDIVADVGKLYELQWTLAVKAAGAVVTWFVNGPLAFIKQEVGVFTQWWAQNGAEVREVATAVWSAVSAVVTEAWRIIWDVEIHPGLVMLEATWRVVWGLVRDSTVLVWNVIKETIQTDIRIVLDIISVVLDLLTGHWSKAWSDLKKLASDALHGCIQMIMTITSGFDTLLYDAGKNIVEGLIHGIESMAGAAGHEILHLGDNIKGAFMGAIHALSPSKDFYQFGVWIVQGLGNGITETAQQAIAKSRDLAEAVKQAFLSKKITSAEATELLGEITEDLTSREDKLKKAMQQIGLEMRAGLLSSLENAATRAQANSAVSKLITYVKEAWSAGDISLTKASSMTSWLEADNDRLMNLAQQRQKLAATIKAADAYANTTTSNTESWAGLSNITSSMTSGGMVYSGNILSGMKADLSSINQFSAAIKRLGHLGLSKNLLNQLIQMGPQQGLQVATALLDGPLSVIRSMNATQSAINSASSGLGQTAANLMYDSGSQAGKGFLSGLQAQQKNITKLMDQIAKSMVETIERDLKIHSPSLVTTEHGEMFALGLANGMQHGVPWVKNAAHALSAATSLTDGHGGTAAGTAGGVTQTINVTVNVPEGFVGSAEELARELRPALQAEFLQYAHRNGDNGLELRF